jgi:NADH-quinone oxidoreductase subunit G
VNDWVIEGPRAFEKDSVINQNNYTQKLEKVEIATEKNILLGRDEDRKKISMAEIPLNTNNKIS